MSLIQSIEAAKKRIPPIPFVQFPRLIDKLKSHPNPSTLKPDEFARYLEGIRTIYGVGIKVAVCMLAVLSKGRFPPIDEKVVKGLVNLQLVTREDGRILNGQNVQAFSKVFVRQVHRHWRRALSDGKTPEEIDKEWTDAGEASPKPRGLVNG